MQAASSILSLVTALLLGTVSASAQNSPSLRDQHVALTVIGEMSHLQAGQPYRLGLLLDHDPGWHTYWKSTATGYATSVEWDLPEGFTVTGISWPTPIVYDFLGWTEFVYENQALLVLTLIPPDTLEVESVEIGFSAEWLMCEKVCIPGSASSSLTLPVLNTPPEPSPKWAATFREADHQMPVPPGVYRLEAWKETDSVVLEVTGDLPESLYFFDDQAVFKARTTIETRRLEADTIRLFLPLDEASKALPDRLSGVLRAAPGWPGLANRPGIVVDIPVSDGPPSGAAGDTGKLPLGFSLLLLAFLGGLILNLMPCVFPVLGIKIMGFVGQAGSSRAKIVSHGLVFTAGVIISFWILAAALLIFRASGNQLGWGFQLQSPGFVFSLTIILFIFGLNLSGLFEVGQSVMGVGSNLAAKSGFGGSFFSGVLATVVATPCAAPFLAPALGAALALPALSSFVTFTVIGLGLSTPYLLLSGFPGLVNKLPRPGPWMETFKQFMAFLLYATVAYLLWVLAGQLTESAGYPAFSFLKILLSLVLVALATWIYGKWASYNRRKQARFLGTMAALGALAGALLTGFSGTRSDLVDGRQIHWLEWEPGKAESLAAEGRIVYVDFTARWCVTCQTNKATVFSSSRVLEQFDQMEVVSLKADWTHQDPRISKALEAYGRSAVPFNLVYGPGFNEPRVLPEILTPGVVLEAIQSAAGPR